MRSWFLVGYNYNLFLPFKQQNMIINFPANLKCAFMCVHKTTVPEIVVLIITNLPIKVPI